MARASKKSRRKLLILGNSDLFERIDAARIAGCDLFLAPALGDARRVMAAHPDLLLLLVSSAPGAAGRLRTLRAEYPQLRAVVLAGPAARARASRSPEGDGTWLLAEASLPAALREAVEGVFEKLEQAAAGSPAPAPLPPASGRETCVTAAPWLASHGGGVDLRLDCIQVLTHDLRTPLGIQNAYAGLLLSQEYGLGADARDLVERIRAGGEWMLSLVDGLLDMALASTGQVRLAYEPTALNPLLDGVLERMRGLAEPQGVRLERLPCRDAKSYRLDRVRIEQVLNNLVANAIKASPPGSVVRIGARSSGGRLSFSVRDQGHGMTPAQAEQAFVTFTSHSGGHGLGLAICKTIVELHGGRIWMESRSGRGTQINFTIVPLAAAVPAGRVGAVRRQRAGAAHRK